MQLQQSKISEACMYCRLIRRARWRTSRSCCFRRTTQSYTGCPFTGSSLPPASPAYSLSLL